MKQFLKNIFSVHTNRKEKKHDIISNGLCIASFRDDIENSWGKAGGYLCNTKSKNSFIIQS